MSGAEEKIARFIKRSLEFIPAASRFVLVQTDVDNREQLIDTIKVPDGTLDAATLAVATRVLENAHAVTEAMAHIAKFKLNSYIRVKSGLDGKFKMRHQSTCIFHLAGKLRSIEKGGMEAAAAMVGVGESEPPNEKGLAGQAMRHAEAYAKMMIEAQRESSEHQRLENQSMRTELNARRELDAKMHADREALFSEQHKRDMEVRKFESTKEMRMQMLDVFKTELMPKLAVHVPDILEKLGLAPPANPEDKFAKIKEAFLGIDQEAQKKVLAVFKEADPKRYETLVSTLLQS